MKCRYCNNQAGLIGVCNSCMIFLSKYIIEKDKNVLEELAKY